MMPPVKEPLAGLALLVIFGLLLWYNRPIESSRPFDPYIQQQAPRITGNTYESWLWKDPFGFDPASASGGAFEAQKAWDQAVKEKKPDKQSGDPVKAKKGEKKKPDGGPEDLSCQVLLEKIISGISDEGRSVKILAPLVKVTPDTVENKEIRTRQRYAVVAGLLESGYRPREPELLHFCSIQEHSREYDMRWEHYKYASKENAKPDIVVAWIDSKVFTAEKEFLDDRESTAGRNLARRNFALKTLLSSEKMKNNKIYIFDLNNSLSKTRSEQLAAEIKGIDNKNIKLIKPAGMEGETGNEDLAKKLAAELTLRGIKRWSEVIAITEQGSENAAMLASNLQRSLRESFAKQECARQGCASQNCGKAECGKQQPDNGSGATNTDKIRNVFYLKGSDGNPKKIGTQDKNENQAADKTEHASVIDLHQPPPLPVGPGQLDYFHRLAGEIRNVHETVDIDKRDSGAKAVVILGSDFNDKLLIIEALREKIPHLLILTTELDAQMLYPKHWRSTRNLVVASHFDLLLQEKTKNDKNREAENKNKNEDNKTDFWQRAVQAQFPPFRDSQQTNIFYRTLAIAEGKASSIEESKNTFPRVFEVGRNGFVRLDGGDKNNNLDYHNLGGIVSALMLWSAAEKNNELDYHPADNSREDTERRLALLLGIALSLIGVHFAIRPKSAILSTYLFVGTLGIFAIAFVFAKDKAGEPFSFTDGVSLWPALFIQIIAILWAIALFFRAVSELDENFCDLSRGYFSGCLKDLPVCRGEYGLEKCGWRLKKLSSFLSWLQFKWEPWLGRLCGLSRSSLLDLLIVLLLFLVGSAVVYAWNDVYPSSILSFWPCLVILVVAAIFFINLFETREYVSIKRWIEKIDSDGRKSGQNVNPGLLSRAIHWLCKFFHLGNTTGSASGQGNYEDGLWQEYYSYGLLSHRLIRVVAIWLVFAIIETLLVYLLPPWPLPWRGNAGLVSSINLASWIAVTSFVVTMLLLFFILDAVRLDFYWIYKLRKQHPLLKERTIQEDIDAYNNAAKDYPAESLEKIVSLVAERTRAVDKLIYYPMLCIMLMLFAKITYFDNQDFPLSKGITFGAAISFLFFSGFMLRHEANQLKLSVRKSLKNLRKNNNFTEEKMDNSLKRIDAIDEGAFQPMMEQPVMQALLIVLASIGLFAGEYLKLFG